MNVRYVVELDPSEKEELLSITSKGRHGARKCKRAQILLLANQGESDANIARLLSVGTSTIYRTKKRFVEDCLDDALVEQGHRRFFGLRTRSGGGGGVHGPAHAFEDSPLLGGGME